MREILFRAKTLDEGEWVYGYYGRKGVDEKTYKHYICKPVFNSNGTTYNGEFYFEDIEVVPKTVCQYTGLTDKNGKKIFDGDIVKITNPYDKSISYYISFKSSSFVANQIGINFCTYLSEFYCGVYEIEIIGNKFENPELVEVEE